MQNFIMITQKKKKDVSLSLRTNWSLDSWPLTNFLQFSAILFYLKSLPLLQS